MNLDQVTLPARDLERAVAFYRALRKQGIRFESMPADQPWLWREARLRDPGGSDLCLHLAGENQGGQGRLAYRCTNSGK